jgi:hypothetical protein
MSAIDISTTSRSPPSAPSPPATPQIGEKIADAMEVVGKDGVITVEDSQTFGIDIDTVEGMQFDKGYISPYFATDTEADVSRDEGPLHPDDLTRRSPTSRTSCRASRPCRRAGSQPADHRRRTLRARPWRP